MERHLLATQGQVPETFLQFKEPRDSFGSSQEHVWIFTRTHIIKESASVEKEMRSVTGKAGQPGVEDPRTGTQFFPSMWSLGQETAPLAQFPLCGVEREIGLTIFPTQIVFRYTPFPRKYHWALNLCPALS